MVSKNPNPTEGFYLGRNGMALLPGFGAFAPPPDKAASTTSPSEDPSKKLRKPYTITKSRESWTEPEHDKFLEALQLFDRDWKKIEAFIGSKTVIQIRSHAQKYFQKVQKSGTNEHLPPPRPKRKAAHQYPQKASKIDKVPPKSSGSPSVEQGHAREHDSSSILRTPTNSAPPLTWANKTVPIISLPQTTKVADMTTNCCSSTESTPRARPTSEPIDQMLNTGHMLRVLPDFAQVYRFIGSFFDPDASEQQQKLKKMDPIDVETVLLLMRNLSINLASPDFEDHRKLLSTSEIDSDTTSNQWQCK